MSSTPLGSILIIDDEPVVRESMAVYLEDSGYHVRLASNGEDGIKQFETERPDLVICDLRMPVMDGLDVLRRIEVDAPETPVVMVSGQGSMSDVVSALRLGAIDYLVKPVVELEVLEHAVRRALERGQLLRQNRQYREQLEVTNVELERSLDILEADQEAGRRVQMRMLPPTPYVVHNVNLSHRIIPSLYLSGDFVDYFKIGADRVGFYLADVSGHGASSAFVTVFLKTLTNRIQRHYEKRTANLLSPARMLANINQELLAMELGKHLAMFCGVIDLPENRLTYCMGAHFPPPILVNGDTIQTLAGSGLPVGLFADASYEDIVVELAPNFTLMAMSDGVLEVLPQASLAEKEAQLLELVRTGHREVESLAKALGVEGDDVEVPDDIALLAIARSD